MASGDTKTQQYLDIAARGTRADLQRGCCNTRTQDLIMDVAERIITEEETRYREDQILQGEIDEIKNNPDVYDIVATYADLQDYDTSTITDKDIIRVLRDETHDNASTYYRWDAADQEFDYIGETGDYYTKAQVNALLALKADKATTYTKTETDALLDGKQDVLTAGENITIEDESGSLVVSATDTTYSDFTGTDGTSAGEAGLVPAPATTDAGKFLKADGTWEAISGNSDFKVLSSTDYNYPANNPTAVALWLLPPGVYMQPSTAIDVYGNNEGRITSINAGTFIVGNTKESNVKILVYGSSSDSSAMIYSTNVVSGGKNYVRHLIDETRIADTLTSTSTDFVLPVKAGKTLNDKIEGRLITNAGAPTTATVGTVGQLLEDTTNGKLYICTDATGGTYTWVEVGAGGGGSGITELTSADYNYPVNNPDGVARWLLDPGYYECGETIKLYYDNSTSGNTATAKFWVFKDMYNRAIIVSPSGGYLFLNSIKSDGSTAGEPYQNAAVLSASQTINNLTSTDAFLPLSANQGRVLKNLVDSLAVRASGAPTTSTVGQVGTLYEDTTNGKLYQCTAVSGNTYTWTEVGAGGGGGPTVVQTTGTSTTDVMSQNAVTSMVYSDPATKRLLNIGGNSSATGNFSVAIGHDAFTTSPSGLAILGNAKGEGSIAIGVGATTSSGKKAQIALGAYSGTTAQGEMNIGCPNYTTYGYNNSQYRLLTGLYDGQSAHDAATYGQMNTRLGGLTLVSISQTDYDNLQTKDANTLYVITGA